MIELVEALSPLHGAASRRAAPGIAAGAGARSGRAGRFLRRAVREPFLHFVILGAGLFFLNHHLEERARFTHIVIGRDQVRGIAENYRLQYGAYPSAAQLDNLVDSYTREEVFYHEAQKLGLDKDDEIIRRRLVQKYEFLQQDLGIAREPTDADLQAWLAAHADQYRLPARISFTQVYFSPDQRGESAAEAAAARTAAQLNAQGAVRAADAGDRFPGPEDFASLTPEEAAKVFGKEGLSQALFSVKPGHWSEPLHSGFGWHTVKVSDLQPSRPAGLAEVRDNVRRDYLEDARARRNAEVYAQLRKGFEIVRE